MPSASAKLVKQPSTEAPDPLRQGIIVIEHKIRNLEKRKGKLEGYRALQAEGKDLQPEQLSAVAKYDEVIQTLEFARDLCKQFNSISSDCAKLAKKQARKEAIERQANDLARIKEVLLLQNVLNQIGTDNIREDFLNGRNGAITLSESDLELFDTFYETVNPKLFEEATNSIEEQLSTAAEHYLSLADGKPKEFAGSTYAALKERMHTVHSCGYFDKPSQQAAVAAEEAPVENAEAPVIPEEAPAEVEEAVLEPTEAVVAVNSTFQATPEAVPPQQLPHVQHVVGQQQTPPQQVAPQAVDGASFFSNLASAQAYAEQGHNQHPVPVQQVPLRTSDVINSVTSAGSFNFLQDSEIESPDVAVPAAPHQMPAPIPSQTFTNQTFTTSPVNPPPASAVPMYQPHMAPVHHVPVPPEGFVPPHGAHSLPPPIPMPPSHLQPGSPSNAANAPVMGYPQQMYSPQGDTFDQSRTEIINENNSVEGIADQTQSTQPQQPPANTDWSDAGEWSSQTNNDEWSTQQSNQNEWSQSNSHNNNDGGYQTQRGNRDRGDREHRGRGRGRGQFNGYGGRGRGGNDNKGYQTDRPYFRNNNAENNGNFYQNGYNKDGQGQGGGYRGRGPREGGMDRPRQPRGGMDRGGPRGGGRGAPRGRGGYNRGGVAAGGPGLNHKQ